MPVLCQQITESEVVSESVNFLCKAHGISYYRFNPELDKVLYTKTSATKHNVVMFLPSKAVSAGETDITTLVDMIMKARYHIVQSIEFQKLILSFERVEAYRKLLSPSYSEKLQKLLLSSKSDLESL